MRETEKWRNWGKLMGGKENLKNTTWSKVEKIFWFFLRCSKVFLGIPLYEVWISEASYSSVTLLRKKINPLRMQSKTRCLQMLLHFERLQVKIHIFSYNLVPCIFPLIRSMKSWTVLYKIKKGLKMSLICIWFGIPRDSSQWPCWVSR